MLKSFDIELEAQSYYSVEAETEEEAIQQAIQMAQSDLTHDWKLLFAHCSDSEEE